MSEFFLPTDNFSYYMVKNIFFYFLHFHINCQELETTFDSAKINIESSFVQRTTIIPFFFYFI